MALLKLNRLYWNFADDEAFQLEIDCLPELWQKTAIRVEGQLMPGYLAAAWPLAAATQRRMWPNLSPTPPRST